MDTVGSGSGMGSFCSLHIAGLKYTLARVCVASVVAGLKYYSRVGVFGPAIQLSHSSQFRAHLDSVDPVASSLPDPAPHALPRRPSSQAEPRALRPLRCCPAAAPPAPSPASCFPRRSLRARPQRGAAAPSLPCGLPGKEGRRGWWQRPE